MSAVSSYKPVTADTPVHTVTKVAKQKPKRQLHKQLFRGGKVQKHMPPTILVGKRLKQKSINTGIKLARTTTSGKPVSDARKVKKPKQHRQHRDHVESLIDGLTDYFATHGERRLKSPALKSLSSYAPESCQAASPEQLDSPTTETCKQLLYSSQLGHTQPRKQKKATVEKLFDGLSTFFSVQNEHRRPNTSQIAPGSEETEAILVGGQTSSDIKFSHYMNVPLKLSDRKRMEEGNSQLKGLFDGLSHLYTAHGDRKRNSPFFYTVQPTKVRSLPCQRPALPVKQKLKVQDTSPASETDKVSKDKQQKMPGKLIMNKSPLLKKSSKPVTPVVKRQSSTSGLLLCYH